MQVNRTLPHMCKWYNCFISKVRCCRLICFIKHNMYGSEDNMVVVWESKRASERRGECPVASNNKTTFAKVKRHSDFMGNWFGDSWLCEVDAPSANCANTQDIFCDHRYFVIYLNGKMDEKKINGLTREKGEKERRLHLQCQGTDDLQYMEVCTMYVFVAAIFACQRLFAYSHIAIWTTYMSKRKMYLLFILLSSLVRYHRMRLSTILNGI